MYRATILRVACDRCGDLHRLEAVQLTGGGHRCWRCQVGDEIGAHQRSVEVASKQRQTRNLVWSSFAIAILGPILFLVLFGLFVMALMRGIS